MYNIGIKPGEVVPMTKEEKKKAVKEAERIARELTLVYLQKSRESFTSEKEIVEAYNISHMKIKDLLLSQLDF